MHRGPATRASASSGGEVRRVRAVPQRGPRCPRFQVRDRFRQQRAQPRTAAAGRAPSPSRGCARVGPNAAAIASRCTRPSSRGPAWSRRASMPASRAAALPWSPSRCTSRCAIASRAQGCARASPACARRPREEVARVVDQPGCQPRRASTGIWRVRDALKESIVWMRRRAVFSSSASRVRRRARARPWRARACVARCRPPRRRFAPAACSASRTRRFISPPPCA